MNKLQPKHNLNAEKIGFAYDMGECGRAKITPFEVVT